MWITRLHKLTLNEPPNYVQIKSSGGEYQTALMTKKNKMGYNLNFRTRQSSILKHTPCTHLATNGVVYNVRWWILYQWWCVCGLWWQVTEVLCRYWMCLHTSSPQSRPLFIKSKQHNVSTAQIISFYRCFDQVVHLWWWFTDGQELPTR